MTLLKHLEAKVNTPHGKDLIAEDNNILGLFVRENSSFIDGAHRTNVKKSKD